MILSSHTQTDFWAVNSLNQPGTKYFSDDYNTHYLNTEPFIVIQNYTPVKKFPAFMDTKYSSPLSQKLILDPF